MNSASSAPPFAIFTSDNLKCNEILRSKARFLQELSKINEFHVKSHNLMTEEQKSSDGRASKTSSKDVDARMTVLSEENKKTTSRSVSCLQRKNISSSKTVVKVCSKMSLSKESKTSKLSETHINFENDSFPSTSLEIPWNGRNLLPEEDPDADIKWEASDCSKKARNVGCSRKKKIQPQNTEDRNIGEPFLSCPFELIEIYPFKKKRLTDFHGGQSDTSQEGNSIRCFPKEDESSKSTHVEEHGCLPSGVGSNKMAEKVWLIDSYAGSAQQNDGACQKNCGISSNTKNKDILVEPTRDRQDLNTVKTETDIKETNETTPLCDRDGLKETFKCFTLESQVVDDLNLNFVFEEGCKFSVREKEEESDEKIDLKKSGRSKDTPKRTSEEVHCSSAVEDNPEVSRLRKLCAKSDKSPSTNYNTFVNDLTSLEMQTENKDLMVTQEEDEKLKCQSVFSTSSNESSAFDNNVFRQSSASSNDSGTSGSTMSKRSSITELSTTEASSMEDTVINLKKMKSNPETNNSGIESPREKRMKIIIQKRENKKDNTNLEAVTENKTDFYGKDGGRLKTDDTKSEPRASQKKIKEIEMIDSENGIIKLNKGRRKFKSEEMRLSTILTWIYQYLVYNWERMKYVRMKLEGSVSTESNDFMTMIRLLGKTIARYKSYIDGSNDDSKAVAEIKHSWKYLEELTAAVDKSRLFLESLERQLECVQLKPLLDRDSSEKRRILGDVISFSNEWTNEVSNLIESLSNLIINVIVNNEEKENVKDPRRYKSTDRRASNTLPANYKQSKAVRSQTTRMNLTKKDSSVETQMAGTFNSVDPVKESVSKTFMKTMHTLRNREREKLLNVDQNGGAEEKTYKGRHAKKSTLSSANQWRQKYRTSTNTQPVWRPGGAAKIPASFSATILAKEKVNQPTKNTKETKQGRATSECKKKIPTETYFMKDAVTPRIIDHYKLSNKNSSISLKTSPRLKSRTGTVKAILKGNNGHHHAAETITSKNCEKIAKQRSPREPRIFYVREVIEPTTDTIMADENARYQFQAEADSILFKSSSSAEIKINEEEPTRDVDSSHLVKDRIKTSGTFHENLCPIEKLPEQSLTLLSNTILSKDSPSLSIANCKDAVDKNVASSRLKIHSSFDSIPSASCATDLLSNLDFAVEIEPSKCCQTSSNSISSSISRQEQRNKVPGQSDNLQESCIDNNQTGQKTRKSPVNREKRLRATSRVTSLSILKEFLCEQGVDPDLVNKAEQCLKEKQKTRSSLKRKSMTSADVSSSKKDLQSERCQEDRSEANIENCKGDSTEHKNPRNVDKVANYPSLQPQLEKKDAATCMAINSKDASSQTTPPRKLNNSSQNTEPETLLTAKQQVSATQTDTTQMRDIATEYHEQVSKDSNLGNKNRDASSMTEFSLINDYFKETVQVSYASKSVATEPVDCIQLNNSTKKLEEDSHQDFDNKIQNKDKDNQKLTKDCHHAFNVLLNQMYEGYNESLTNRKESDEVCEQDSVERDTSESVSCSDLSSMCSDNCVNNKTVIQGESRELPAREVSSEVIAALQVAAIRARNVYRAIDLHKHDLQEKLKKLKKRREEIIKQNRNTRRETVTNVYKSNSVTSITKRLEHFGENDIVEVSKTLRRFEVATTFDKQTESTSSTSVSFTEDTEKIETIVSKRSSSKTVIRDTGSSKESLVHETKEASFEQIECVQKISSSTCSKLHDEQTESEKTQRHDKYSVFTRENLLPLVYGVVCSIVFWCLQFTITCDVVS